MDREKAFFEQWNIYQNVIRYNYMYHKEIIEVLREVLLSKASISILDLGCGDSHILKHSISSTHHIEYLGIDSALKALEYSAKNLSSLDGDIAHIHGDFLEEVSHLKKKYDVIIVGYSLHHLTTKDKEKFFALVSSLLAKEGVLFFYDIYSYEDEDLEAYIHRACSTYERKWTHLDTHEMASVITHVKENDIPQSEMFYKQNMYQNGIVDIEKKFIDEDNLFAIYIGHKI